MDPSHPSTLTGKLSHTLIIFSIFCMFFITAMLLDHCIILVLRGMNLSETWNVVSWKRFDNFFSVSCSEVGLLFYKPSSLTMNILLPGIFLGSQNHCINHVRKDLRGHLLQCVKNHVNTEFRLLRALPGKTWKSGGQRFHNLARQPLPMLNYPHSEWVFLLKSEPLILIYVQCFSSSGQVPQWRG